MTDIDKKREEIDRDIEFVLMAAYLAGQTGESVGETKDKCKSYLKEALHTQDVVIKVDRELPNNPLNSHKDHDHEAGYYSAHEAYDLAQEDMSGYVAVGSLRGDDASSS